MGSAYLPRARALSDVLDSRVRRTDARPRPARTQFPTIVTNFLFSNTVFEDIFGRKKPYYLRPFTLIVKSVESSNFVLTVCSQND